MVDPHLSSPPCGEGPGCITTLQIKVGWRNGVPPHSWGGQVGVWNSPGGERRTRRMLLSLICRGMRVRRIFALPTHRLG